MGLQALGFRTQHNIGVTAVTVTLLAPLLIRIDPIPNTPDGTRPQSVTITSSASGDTAAVGPGVKRRLSEANLELPETRSRLALHSPDSLRFVIGS